MNSTRTLAGLTAAVLIGLTASLTAGVARAADAEPLNLDANLLAKIAHQRVKSKVDTSDPSYGMSDQNQASGCGQVDIGNINTPSRPGMPQRETTVIVTGDVINATKCK